MSMTLGLSLPDLIFLNEAQPDKDPRSEVQDAGRKIQENIYKEGAEKPPLSFYFDKSNTILLIA